MAMAPWTYSRTPATDDSSDVSVLSVVTFSTAASSLTKNTIHPFCSTHHPQKPKRRNPISATLVALTIA